MKADRVNDFLRYAFGWIPARIALAVMAWFGFINLYMTRINISVIIVAMVRRKTSSDLPVPCLAGDNNTSTVSPVYLSSEPEHLGSSTVTPVVEEDEDIMDWDETTQGLILGSFFYGYFMTQIIGGRLAELYGTKWIFGGCILSGGICAVLSPTIARLHYGVFIALRIIQGLLQGVSWPSMHACLSQWIPPLERPRFIATVYFGNNLSTAMTLPLCGLIIDAYGWPAAFYVTGSLSIIWCLFWFSFMHSYPAQHPRISSEELQYIETTLRKSGTSSNAENKSSHVPWKAIFTSLPMWALILGCFGNSWTSGLMFTQLPTYMKNILGFSIKANGALSALPFVFRYAGAIILSICADWMLTRGYFSIRTTRRIFGTIAMWIPAMMLLGVAHSGCNWKVIVVLFCAALFFNGAVASSTIVNITDIAPNFSGTLFGIINMSSTVASFIVPVITGIMTDGQQTLGQWQKVFWMSVPMYVVLHLIFFIFCSGDVQSWNYAGKNTCTENMNEEHKEIS